VLVLCTKHFKEHLFGILYPDIEGNFIAGDKWVIEAVKVL